MPLKTLGPIGPRAVRERVKSLFSADSVTLTLSPMNPRAPSCPTALGLIGPRKKGEKTGYDDVS